MIEIYISDDLHRTSNIRKYSRVVKNSLQKYLLAPKNHTFGGIGGDPSPRQRVYWTILANDIVQAIAERDVCTRFWRKLVKIVTSRAQNDKALQIFEKPL